MDHWDSTEHIVSTEHTECQMNNSGTEEKKGDSQSWDKKICQIERLIVMILGNSTLYEKESCNDSINFGVRPNVI